MHDDTRISLIKLGWVWLMVGLSHMTPLQVGQLAAACAATIYTILQTIFLLKDRLARRQRPRKGRP